MNLQFDNRTPVYIQVIDYFKKQIASGEMELGDELPSRRELANQLKINPNTVQKAFREMEESGLIVTEGNLPSRVTEDEKVIKGLREELIRDAVDEFMQLVQTIDMPLEDVIELIKENYGK